MQRDRRPDVRVGNNSVSDLPAAISGDLPTQRQDAAKTTCSVRRLVPAVFLAVVVACLVVPLLETLHPFFPTIERTR